MLDYRLYVMCERKKHAAALGARLPSVGLVHVALGDLLREPVPTGAIADGLVLQAGWIVVALTIAWSRFTTRDITS